MPPVARAVVGLWLVAAGLGCAHRSQFTSAEELRKLTQQPKPQKAFTRAAIEVPRYELAGPFADGWAPHEQASPWGALFTASAQGRFEVDGALGCAAREVSRFSLAHQGSPSQSLEAFILARCGSTTAYVSSETLSGEVTDATSDAELLAHWKDNLQAMIDRLEPGSKAGLALARAGGKAWLTILSHRSFATVKAGSRLPDAEGKVVVEGRVEQKTEKVSALINQGSLGWSECTEDKAVALPSFRFVCTARKEDPRAWLSIGAWEPDRVLGKTVARVLIWPAGEPSNAFEAPGYAQSGPPTAEAFLERVNVVRASASLQPLRLAPAQSSTAAGLAPHFFGGADGPQNDKIALGLMAGWDVEGLVVSGTFNAEWAAQPDSGALLSGMLEDPGGRRGLLDPRASLISAGLVSEGNLVGALISTYVLMAEVVDPIEAPKQLVALLNEARAKLGKGPAQWIANPSNFYTRAAQELLANELSPTEAAEEFMEETVRFTRRPVRGLTQTVQELDKVQWAEDVLAHPSPQVLIFVGVQKPKGAAWGGYVVLVLLLEGAPGGPQA